MEVCTLCPLCNSKKHNVLIQITDYRYKIGRDRSLIKCEECECNYVWPIPKDLLSQYPDEYSAWDIVSKPKTIKNVVKSKIYYWLTGRRIFDFTKNILNIINNGNKKLRLLEIGPGSGKLLDYCKSKGFITYGLEVSDKANKILFNNGHEVIDWESIHLEKRFDIIVMHHVLEHFSDPMYKMKELYKVLKKGGEIIDSCTKH